ncbi:hypothetical protein Trydic_g4205 [Trypoxylus dichotomus]
MASTKASKDALRKEIAKRIELLTDEEKRKQSDKVIQKLFGLQAFLNSDRISVYLSTENEINTENIVRRIFELNKKCYVPRYDRQIMEMVKLNDMKDWETLPLTKWKIKQPLLSEVRENALDAGGLDLIILPGVAFTADGKRLGHGKGYYDKFQSNLLKKQKFHPTTIGIALKEQIVDDIPTNEYDVKLDMVLYPD